MLTDRLTLKRLTSVDTLVKLSRGRLEVVAHHEGPTALAVKAVLPKLRRALHEAWKAGAPKVLKTPPAPVLSREEQLAALAEKIKAAGHGERRGRLSEARALFGEGQQAALDYQDWLFRAVLAERS